MAKDLWTIGRILEWTTSYFADKGIESPRIDGELLLAHVLKKDRIYLYTHYDEPLTTSELDAYRPLVIQRGKGYSVAVIVGHKEFMGLSFKVDDKVLIPRPDTETLVEQVLAMTDKDKPVKILDLGVGSGTILLSLLHYLPKAAGIGLDISMDALTVAKDNANNLELAQRVLLLPSDLFTALVTRRNEIDSYLKQWDQSLLSTVFNANAQSNANVQSESGESQRRIKEESMISSVLSQGQQVSVTNKHGLGEKLLFDWIVSNPPYIPESDKSILAPEVLHEPSTALFGGADGLDYYRRILAEAYQYLADDGHLIVEIGIHQAQAVSDMAEKIGHYGPVSRYKDLAGIERVLCWQKK